MIHKYNYLRKIIVVALCLFLVNVIASADSNVNSENDNSFEKFLKGEKLLIRGNFAFAPFESIDENNNMVGFDIDLMKAIMRTLKLKYEIKLQTLDSSIVDIENGDADIILGIVYNDERNKHFSYGLPVYYINRKIISNSDSKIDSKSQLTNKRIAVQSSGWSRNYLNKEKITDKVVYCKDMKECLQSLNDHKVDAVIASDCASYYEIKKNNFKNLYVADLGLRAQPYSFAVSRGNEELLFRINMLYKH